MSEATVAQALETIYTSLNNDNDDIDNHITRLKAAMTREGVREVTVDPARLAHNNRQGRKLMQSYFRKRGVTVLFGS